MKYPIIICGGTFDLLHAGHKNFLRQVFEKGERVVIGLTSDKYVSLNKSGKNVSSYHSRKKGLENFIKENGVEGRVKILQIDDIYGPLLDPNFKVNAIAVTLHSRENAGKINSERTKHGLKLLEIIEIPLVTDKEGEVISSSRIRQNLLLPSTLRPLLQDTWGEILNDVPLDVDLTKIITVGDVTSGKFIEKGIFPKLMIIDNKVERKDKKFEYNISPEYKVVKVENPAGSISPKLSQVILHFIQNDMKGVIIVDGEEDLAVLPTLLYAPLGFNIFYGQPHKGMVRLEVTEINKERARNIIDKFEIA